MTQQAEHGARKVPRGSSEAARGRVSLETSRTFTLCTLGVASFALSSRRPVPVNVLLDYPTITKFRCIPWTGEAQVHPPSQVQGIDSIRNLHDLMFNTSCYSFVLSMRPWVVSPHSACHCAGTQPRQQSTDREGRGRVRTAVGSYATGSVVAALECGARAVSMNEQLT